MQGSSPVFEMHLGSLQLATKTVTVHQQHFCFSYSLASVLFYCGFQDASEYFVAMAKGFCAMHYDRALSELMSLMLNSAPLIARPTIYGKRTLQGTMRRLTFEDVFTHLTPYPTLIVLRQAMEICTKLFVSWTTTFSTPLRHLRSNYNKNRLIGFSTTKR